MLEYKIKLNDITTNIKKEIITNDGTLFIENNGQFISGKTNMSYNLYSGVNILVDVDSNEHILPIYCVNDNTTNTCQFTIYKEKNQILTLDKVGCGDFIEPSFEWVENEEICPCLSLYLHTESSYYPFEGEYTVKAVKTYNNDNRYVVTYDNSARTEGYVVVNGEKYCVSEDTIDFIEVNGVEYEVTYTSGCTEGYFILNGIPIHIKLNDNNSFVRVNESFAYSSLTTTEYVRNQYHYIQIDDVLYLVRQYTVIDKVYDEEYKEEYSKKNITKNDDGEDETLDYIIVDKPLEYIFDIGEKIGNNILICSLHKDNNEDSNVDEDSNIIREIVLNQKHFSFYVVKNTFNVDNNIKLYTLDNSIKIPLYLESSNAYNLYQEDVVNMDFVSKTINERINNIVDMEHDVYYPVFKDKKDNYIPIQELVFDLHFRTRNENNEIIEDGNWNFFDNYNYNYYLTNYPDEDIRTYLDYYQPSDLLCFLGFNDNDVFYQKSKLAKSFLRLSFYDSPNSFTQSLLATSTIFVDEKALFTEYCKTYTNTFLPYNKLSQDTTNQASSTEDNLRKYQTKLIGVNLEGIIFDKGVIIPTFDEDERISSRLRVQNKYMTSTSSEGFYIYLFREYINPSSETETLYMRAQFHHAGTGKILDMVFPFDSEGKILNMGKSGNVQTFKEGYSLSELNEHLYTPIKVAYDKQNKQCVYYLPEELTPSEDIISKTTMRFNLYELKVKNES